MSRRRAALFALSVIVAALALAPSAFATTHGGQGLYGPTDDQTITNTMFILIVLFPVIIIVFSLIQAWLDHRKHARHGRRQAPRLGGGVEGRLVTADPARPESAAPQTLGSVDGVLRHRRDRLHRQQPRPVAAERTARKRGANGDIYLLVRESSLARLEQLIDTLDGEDSSRPARLKPVVGDLHEPLLGIDPETIAALREQGIAHFFHLAAVYDMTAGAEVNQLANVEGTHHALELADAVGARLLHHVSSIAVAGMYRGVFREDMFDVGQPLDHPYHRTKFESERLVRETATMPWRVYRPSIVVGDSRTGRMDKVDGPYYFFPLLKRAHRLRAGLVPADRTRARQHQHRSGRLRRRRARSHRPPARARRAGVPPDRPEVARASGDVLNTFAKVAGRAAVRRHGSTRDRSRRCLAAPPRC